MRILSFVKKVSKGEVYLTHGRRIEKIYSPLPTVKERLNICNCNFATRILGEFMLPFYCLPLYEKNIKVCLCVINNNIDINNINTN